ncbi:MAG: oligosaccharide flippase family protein [Candidatus Korobacteraceae bacterium]
MTTTSAALPATKPPRLAVQAFWLTFSKFVGVVLNVALPILLVRILSQSQYGLYKQAFLVVATAQTIANLGVGLSAFYYMPRQPKRGGQIALNILIYNFFAGLIPLFVVVLYPQVLDVFKSHQLEPFALLLGILSLITLTSSLLTLIPTALEDVKYSTIFVIGTQVVKVIIAGGAALLYRSVEALLVAAVLTQVLSTIVLFWYLYKRFGHFWGHFEWDFFREQLAYAIPIGAYGSLWVVQKYMDNYFVGHYFSPSDFAIYSVGWLDFALFSLVLESIAAVMVVRVSALQHQDRKEEIRRLSANAINRLAAIQFPTCALLLVAGHDLIVLVYTRAYERSAPIFSVAILLLALNAFLIDPVIRAYIGLRKFILVTRIVILVCLFFALTPVIQHFGMLGAAVAAVAAQFIERIIMGWKVASTVDMTAKDLPLYKDLVKVTALTVLAAVAAYAVRNLISPHLLLPRIAAVSALVASIYLPGMYLFRLPGWEVLSKERIFGIVRAALGRTSSSNP